MYKLALCEDEPLQANQFFKVMDRIREELEQKYHVDYFKTGIELMNQPIEDYDLVILDIKLEGISGIDIARQIRQVNCRIKIVFLTAHQQYWSDGYKVLASRYLLKPMDDDRLYQELIDIFNEIEKSRQFVVLTKDKAVVKVRIEEIIYLEIMRRKVLIHTEDEVYCSNNSLSYWYSLLKAHHFCHTHSSYLVNMRYVKSVERDKVSLVSGSEVYMSLRKYRSFKAEFIRYISQV